MSLPRRVLTVSFGYPRPSAPGRMLFTHEQAKGLLRQGAEVTAVDLDDGQPPGRAVYEGVVVERIPLPRSLRAAPHRALRTLLGARRRIADLVRGTDPDLVLLSFIEHKYLPLWSAFAGPRVRRALTAHGVDVLASDLPVPHRRLRSSLLRRADFIFAVSPATAALATRLRGPWGSPVTVIENGVDHRKLDRALTVSPSRHRERLGWSSSRPVLLSVANLVPRKGLDLVLRAAALAGEHRDFDYIVIGRGPERERLGALSRELGLSERVRFLDRPLEDEELAAAFVACDLFVLGSRTVLSPAGMEGFGVAYAEASYVGKPVVGGRSGGVPSVVEHGVTGWLVDPDAPSAVLDLAAHLGRLLDEPNLRTRMGRAGRARARARFDWDLNARRVLEHTAERTAATS